MANLVPASVEMGYPCRTAPQGVPGDVNSFATGTSGASATVTITAPGAGLYILVERIEASYSAAPTGGRITVNDGTNNIFDLDITAAGPSAFVPERLIGPNLGVTVVLAGGGGSVVSKVNVKARTIQ